MTLDHKGLTLTQCGALNFFLQLGFAPTSTSTFFLPTQHLEIHWNFIDPLDMLVHKRDGNLPRAPLLSSAAQPSLLLPLCPLSLPSLSDRDKGEWTMEGPDWRT